MLITAFPAGPLAANCYLVAPDEGGECVVIDPGQRAMGQLSAHLAEYALTPVAVLATHGHFDHVASAGQVCAAYDIPLYIGAGDEPMLTDPWSALSPDLVAVVEGMLGPDESLVGASPAEVHGLGDGDGDAVSGPLLLAGLSIGVLPVPGHTRGSITYRVDPDDGPAVVFTGDTLFARSIGRTDLPGGSSPEILDSIAAQLLTLPDDTVVLPGHGGATTIGAERAGNAFLR